MGKLLKIIGWVVAVVVVLIVAAVLILPQVIDPNDYKEEIVAKVREQTGREFEIDGRIDLSVFPWLGVETGKMRLGNAEGFPGEHFAVVDAVGVRVKLLPLLSRELEADKLTLQGLKLNLARAEDGRGNWEDLAAGQEQASSGPARERPAESDGRGLAGFSIGGIDISDAEISWDDQTTGDRIQVRQLQLQSGAVTAGEPVDLTLDASIESRKPALQAQLSLQGKVNLDEAAGKIAIDDLVVDLDASGETLPGGRLKAMLKAGIAAALDGSMLAVENLELTAADLGVSGALQGRNLATQPVFDGNLELAEFNPRQWLSDMGMALPPMADPKAMTLAAANLQLAAEGDITRIERISARLDDTNITGSASLRGSAIGFDLDVDAIDVDRYLPPPTDGQQAGTAAPNGSQPAAAAGESAQPPTAEEAPLYPLETLRALNLDGVLNIGRIKVNNLQGEQLQLKVKAANGRLSLDQQIGKFYQGTYRGTTVIEAAGKTPRTTLTAAATAIAIGPLLKDLTGEDRLTGSGHFSANLDTSGNTLGAVKRALDGKFDFQFENGAVKGFNLAQAAREAKARLSGKPVPASNQPVQTDFSELGASGTINNGVVSNRDLLAKSPFLRVEGAGTVNLVAENLDYKLRAVIVKSAKGQGGEGLEELQGVTIPVHLTGRYASPKVSVDWEQVLLESQKEKVKEKVREKIKDKLGDKLEKKLPGGLQDKLKGFLN